MAPAPILKLRIFVLVLNVFIALVKAWVFMWSKHPEQTGYEWGYPKWKGRFGRENHDWPEKWLMKKKGFYSKLSHEFPSLSAQRTLGPLGPQRENFSSAWKRGPFFLDPEIKGSWAISIIFCTHQKKTSNKSIPVTFTWMSCLWSCGASWSEPPKLYLDGPWD